MQNQSFNRHNLSNDWHKVSLYRSKYNLIITVNGNEILNCDKLFRTVALSRPKNTIYREDLINLGYLGGFKKYIKMMGEDVPNFLWNNLPHDAPFHENFNLIINLAIGGDFFGDSMNSDSNIVKPPWGNIELGNHPAVQFLNNIEEWYNWGYFEKKNLVCSYSIEECIKDDLPCDKYNECYLDTEKILSIKKPTVDNKAIFSIRNIYFNNET